MFVLVEVRCRAPCFTLAAALLASPYIRVCRGQQSTQARQLLCSCSRVTQNRCPDTQRLLRRILLRGGSRSRSLARPAWPPAPPAPPASLSEQSSQVDPPLAVTPSQLRSTRRRRNRSRRPVVQLPLRTARHTLEPQARTPPDQEQ